MIGRCDRLVDEPHIAEAHALCDRLEHALRLGIGLVVTVDKANRTAVHDGIDFSADIVLRLRLQVPDKQLHNISQRDLSTSERRRLVDQWRAEDRLQRAHQTPLGIAQVGRYTFGAEKDAPPGFVVEEHGTRDQRRIPLDRREHGPSVADHPDRGVRGAEIKSTGIHGKPLLNMKGAPI